MSRPTGERENNTLLVCWLVSVCLAVYLMVLVGGLTRLTGSGLSMVDWQPVTGILPPLSQADWKARFEDYKQYPEYRAINFGMSLAEYKSIFYWEYGHRLLGRFVGLLYLAPFLYFLLRGRIASRWVPGLLAVFILGGIQGLMGWYMVKSGLLEVPWVSHYRLAVHLCLALVILVLLTWLILGMRGSRRYKVTGSQKLLTWLTLGLLAFQILFGAFAAGLKAGHGFNTYPSMHGQFLADAAVMMQPLWRNFVENGVMVQFVHRWLGAAVLLAVCLLSVVAVSNRRLVAPSIALAALTAMQFALGVRVLLLQVPVLSASLHQALACLMVILLVCIVYQSLPEKEP